MANKSFDNVSWLLDAVVSNFCMSIVDDSVKANADFQYNAGMSPKIVRTTDGKCCEWCSKLAGTYDYGKVKNTGNDVFRRHRNCTCVVDYLPGDGRRQNVHSKKWYDNSNKILNITENYSKSFDSYVRRVKLTEEELERIKTADEAVIQYLKKEFPGYQPGKLVNGDESVTNIYVTTHNSNLFSFRRVVCNTGLPPGVNHVDIGNDALANSIHERTHDLINNLAIKRAGIVDESNINAVQLKNFALERDKILQDVFVYCFKDESADEIYDIIRNTISPRAGDAGEFIPESAVSAIGIGKNKLANKAYMYLRREWRKK